MRHRVPSGYRALPVPAQCRAAFGPNGMEGYIVGELDWSRREEWLPEKVAELREDRTLEGELHGAALAAQKEIDHLMRNCHYQEHEAREVALRQFILLPPEPDALVSPEQREESAELEAEYRRNPPVPID
jgi:hypothetical protein